MKPTLPSNAAPEESHERLPIVPIVAFALLAIVGCTSSMSWLRVWPERSANIPSLAIHVAPTRQAAGTIAESNRPMGCCTEAIEATRPLVIEPVPPTPLDQLRAASPEWRPVGESIAGRPIQAALLGTGEHRVLFVGGIHGDEPEGLPLIEWFIEELKANSGLTSELTAGVTVLVIRNLNPDGTLAKTRTNQNGVDLNRNFPAANWDATVKTPRFNPGSKPESEPETRCAVKLIRDFQPERVLVLHATVGKPMNNYDGPGRELARSLSQFNGYAVTDTIGYPTPGSLGSWVGTDLRTPIITLELPRKIAPDKAWAANKLALWQMLKF